MNPKLIAVMMFVLVSVAVVPLMLRMRASSQPKPAPITALDVGTDRTIHITVKTNSQGTLSLQYHVTEGEETLIDHAFFGTLPRTSPPPGFVTYFTDDHNLVGVAQVADPNQIVILHDFADGESFPMQHVTYKDTDTRKSYPYREEEDTILARGDALFDRLAQAHPDKPLTLLRTMGMRPLVLPTGEGE